MASFHKALTTFLRRSHLCFRVIANPLSSQSNGYPDQSSLYTRLEKIILAKNTNDATTIPFVNQLRKTLRAQELRGHFDSDVITTPEALVDIIANYYKSLKENKEKKLLFFTFLAQYLGPDHEDISNSAEKVVELYKQRRDHITLLRSEAQLQKSLRPLYMKLLTLLVKKEGGLKMLIDMRSDLLDLLANSYCDDTLGKDGPSMLLQEFDSHLKDLLSQWFSLGFLDLQQITWQSPCDIVEKVSEYEAVHSVRHWKDIKHRVGPYRRVFIFTHRSVPREPIVILHSALTQSPSSSVQTLLSRDLDKSNDPTSINTAVFYSISSAHKGLSGIDLGNSMILQVVNTLQKEFPDLQKFVTLSPIPGFRKWLDTHLRHYIQTPNSKDCKISRSELSNLIDLYPHQPNHLLTLQQALSNHDWPTDKQGTLSGALKQPLLSLCARYLIQEKRRGFAMNPVTHFHVRNGASLWRINWLGDTSPHGIQQSYSLMINYLYHLPDISHNSTQYLLQGKINCSDLVAELL